MKWCGQSCGARQLTNLFKICSKFSLKKKRQTIGQTQCLDGSWGTFLCRPAVDPLAPACHCQNGCPRCVTAAETGARHAQQGPSPGHFPLHGAEAVHGSSSDMEDEASWPPQNPSVTGHLCLVRCDVTSQPVSTTCWDTTHGIGGL